MKVTEDDVLTNCYALNYIQIYLTLIILVLPKHIYTLYICLLLKKQSQRENDLIINIFFPFVHPNHIRPMVCF